jgi:hypothetical protein
VKYGVVSLLQASQINEMPEIIQLRLGCAFPVEA